MAHVLREFTSLIDIGNIPWQPGDFPTLLPGHDLQRCCCAIAMFNTVKLPVGNGWAPINRHGNRTHAVCRSLSWESQSGVFRMLLMFAVCYLLLLCLKKPNLALWESRIETTDQKDLSWIDRSVIPQELDGFSRIHTLGSGMVYSYIFIYT